MLPKINRLTKDRDFKKILFGGRSFFSQSFRLRHRLNNLEASRFVVVISAKISKKATVRNRLKRQLAEVIRLNLKQIKPGYDLAMYLKKEALDKDYQQLEQELLAALKKMRLVK